VSKNFELMSRAGLGLRANPGEIPPAMSIDLPREETGRSAWVAQEKTPEWLRAVAIVVKHWKLSAIFAAMVIITATIVTFSITPIYEPTARLEVDPPGETFSLNGTAGSSDAEYLETQSQNLKSTRLALAVVRKLGLDRNPDIVPNLQVGGGSLSSSRVGGGQLTPAEDSAMSAVQSRLTTKRDTASRLINVSFASHDPVLAAQVTNTVLETFIDQTFEDQNRSVMKSTEWLSKQLDDIRQRMEESSRTLADYQKSIGVADLDDNRNTFAVQLGELSRQLMQAQADRIQMQALLASVKRGTPDSLPEVRNNPLIQQLSTRLADIKTQLSQAMVTYGTNHPTVKKLQSQADELENQLSQQKVAILASVNTNFAAANAREQLMNTQIQGTTQQLNEMGRYNALKKEAQANAELYNALYAKVKEAGIAAASRSSNLRIVDEARVLGSPTRPNRMLNLGVGIMVGVLGGIALAFLREHTDSRIFTLEDIQQCIGSLNVAILPQVSDEHRLPPAAGARALDATIAAKKRTGEEPRFFLDAPSSPEAEALRSLCTSMMLSNSDRPPQVVLVVSSFPGEGKTTVAMNLAMAMARQGATCIVDADLRRGQVATAFGISSRMGLTDVLEGTIPLEQALISTPNVTQLSAVPSHSGNTNAGQLVCSEAMRQVVRDLRQRFQFVIIDTAPLLPFADGQALSTIVDGLVFVGRSGITTRDAVRRSLELLQQVHGAPILQFVLNGADVNSSDYQYYRQGVDYYDELSAK
jgi:succinoglycan biosynthesis transport protein ExoP